MTAVIFALWLLSLIFVLETENMKNMSGKSGHRQMRFALIFVQSKKTNAYREGEVY